MSKQYYISLLIYSIVKISTVIVWLMMIREDIISMPSTIVDFVKPAYAFVSIFLLLILPKVQAQSRLIKNSLVTLVVGLLLISLYITVTSFFPFVLADYQIGGTIISAIASVIFCIAILTLIYESIKSSNLTSKRLDS